jgi:hypothetical protein
MAIEHNYFLICGIIYNTLYAYTCHHYFKYYY